MKVTKKQVLIALGTISNWALAFAFAKAFANSIANANWELAHADEVHTRSLSRRVDALEFNAHYHPSTVKATRARSPELDDLQPSSTDLD